MAWLLVLLERGPLHGQRAFGEAHQAFIARLVRENRILLGGPFVGEEGGAHFGAYVLACETVAEGRAVAEQDPYISEGVAIPRYVRWQLVGVNPDAIPPDLVLRPADA